MINQDPDPGWVKNQDTDPNMEQGRTSRIIFPRAWKQFFGFKILDGAARLSTVRHGSDTVQRGSDTMRRGSAQCGVAQYGATWLNMVRCGSERFGVA